MPTTIYPVNGDYVQLLDTKENPSENFTLVEKWIGEIGYNLFLIDDNDGESFAITRCEKLDTEARNGWQQVLTETA